MVGGGSGNWWRGGPSGAGEGRMGPSGAGEGKGGPSGLSVVFKRSPVGVLRRELWEVRIHVHIMLYMCALRGVLITTVV